MQVEFLIQLKTDWILHTWWKFQEAHTVFQFCRPSFFFKALLGLNLQRSF